MKVKATTLLQDKLWILESNGEKVGALQKAEDGYTVIRDDKKEKFFTPEELAQHYAITYENTTRPSKKERVLYDFPCKNIPHNELYDVKHRVPIYTTDENSKSFYCAGYFIINQDGKWVKHYCPKLLLVERYPSLGPFKTKIEMNEAYTRVRYE